MKPHDLDEHDLDGHETISSTGDVAERLLMNTADDVKAG
jgi:hypothetical protein